MLSKGKVLISIISQNLCDLCYEPTKEMNDVLGSERGKKIAICNLAKRISSQSFYAVTGYFDSPAAVNFLVKSHT